LAIHNFRVLYPKDEESFPIVFSLDFIFDYNIGVKGRWVIDLSINDVEVIDIDEN
jgi:hypothetical protein